MKFNATANVRVTIELRNVGTWGADCELEQAHRQAKATAIERVMNYMNRDQMLGASVIGEPHVIVVLVEKAD